MIRKKLTVSQSTVMLCWKKAGTFLTLLAFSLNSVAGAMPISIEWNQAGSVYSEIKSTTLIDQISIPESLGKIHRKYYPKRHPGISGFSTVIHIQDAHSSRAAQDKIEKIIQRLVRRHEIKLILLEGASGPLDAERLRFFGRHSLNHQLVDALVRKGEVSGAERFLSNTKTPVKVFGIEDENLYWKNFAGFRRVLARKKDSGNFVKKVKDALGLLGSRHFDPALRNFLKEWMFYQDNETELVRHLEVLKKTGLAELNLDLSDVTNQKDWPELIRYFKIRELETQLDFERVKSDQEKLIRWLRDKKIDPKLVAGIESFFAKHKKSDRTPESSRVFFEKFYREVKPAGFAFKDYPNFFRRVAVETFQNEIDAALLLKESRRLTERILRKLTKTETEQKLVQLFKDYLVLHKLFNLQLSREEFTLVRNHRARFLPSLVAKKINSINQGEIKFDFRETAESDPDFQQAMVFYKTALKRDRAIVRNSIKIMKEQNQTSAIVITGGFHSAGLMKRFKKLDVALAEMTPAITRTESQEDYLNAMMTRLELDSPTASKIKSPLYLKTDHFNPEVLAALNHQFLKVFGLDLRDAILLSPEITEMKMQNLPGNDSLSLYRDFLRLQVGFYQEVQTMIALSEILKQESKKDRSLIRALGDKLDFILHATGRFRVVTGEGGYRFAGKNMAALGYSVRVPRFGEARLEKDRIQRSEIRSETPGKSDDREVRIFELLRGLSVQVKNAQRSEKSVLRKSAIVSKRWESVNQERLDTLGLEKGFEWREKRQKIEQALTAIDLQIRSLHFEAPLEAISEWPPRDYDQYEATVRDATEQIQQYENSLKELDRAIRQVYDLVKELDIGPWPELGGEETRSEIRTEDDDPSAERKRIHAAVKSGLEDYLRRELQRAWLGNVSEAEKDAIVEQIIANPARVFDLLNDKITPPFKAKHRSKLTQSIQRIIQAATKTKQIPKQVSSVPLPPSRPTTKKTSVLLPKKTPAQAAPPLMDLFGSVIVTSSGVVPQTSGISTGSLPGPSSRQPLFMTKNYPATLAGMKTAILDNIDWLLKQGFPRPKILEDFRTVVQAAQEMHRPGSRVWFQKKLNESDGEPVELEINVERLSLMTAVTQRTGSLDYYLENITSAIVREAWGAALMRVMRPPIEDANAKGQRILVEKFSQEVGTRLDWPRDPKLKRFLTEHAETIQEIISILIAYEFEESRHQIEFLDWAQKLGLYDSKKAYALVSNMGDRHLLLSAERVRQMVGAYSNALGFLELELRQKIYVMLRHLRIDPKSADSERDVLLSLFMAYEKGWAQPSEVSKFEGQYTSKIPPQVLMRFAQELLSGVEKIVGEAESRLTALPRPFTLWYSPNLDGVKNLVQNAIDWLIEEGYPFPEVLRNYREAVSSAEEVPEAMRKQGVLFAKMMQGDGAGARVQVYLSGPLLYEFLIDLRELGSVDYFMEFLASSVIREAWGYAVMKSSGQPNIEWEVSSREILSEAKRIFPQGIKWPSAEASRFLSAHADQINNLIVFHLATEYVEAESRYQGLTWAQSKNLYSPERLTQSLDSAPIPEAQREWLKRARSKGLRIVATRGDPEKLVATELQYLTSTNLPLWMSGAVKNATLESYGLFFLVQFEKFVGTGGREGINPEVMRMVNQTNVLPEELFRASARELVGPIEHLFREWQKRIARSEMREEASSSPGKVIPNADLAKREMAERIFGGAIVAGVPGLFGRLDWLGDAMRTFTPTDLAAFPWVFPVMSIRRLVESSGFDGPIDLYDFHTDFETYGFNFWWDALDSFRDAILWWRYGLLIYRGAPARNIIPQNRLHQFVTWTPEGYFLFHVQFLDYLGDTLSFHAEDRELLRTVYAAARNYIPDDIRERLLTFLPDNYLRLFRGIAIAFLHEFYEYRAYWRMLSEGRRPSEQDFQAWHEQAQNLGLTLTNQEPLVEIVKRATEAIRFLELKPAQIPPVLQTAPRHLQESAKILDNIRRYGLQSPSALRHAGVIVHRSVDAAPGNRPSQVGMEDVHGVLLNPKFRFVIEHGAYPIARVYMRETEDAGGQSLSQGMPANMVVNVPPEMADDFIDLESEAAQNWLSGEIFRRSLYEEGGGILGVSLERDTETENDRALLPLEILEERAGNMVIFLTETEKLRGALRPMHGSEYVVERAISSEEITCVLVPEPLVESVRAVIGNSIEIIPVRETKSVEIHWERFMELPPQVSAMLKAILTKQFDKVEEDAAGGVRVRKALATIRAPDYESALREVIERDPQKSFWGHGVRLIAPSDISQSWRNIIELSNDQPLRISRNARPLQFRYAGPFQIRARIKIFDREEEETFHYYLEGGNIMEGEPGSGQPHGSQYQETRFGYQLRIIPQPFSDVPLIEIHEVHADEVVIQPLRSEMREADDAAPAIVPFKKIYHIGSAGEIDERMLQDWMAGGKGEAIVKAIDGLEFRFVYQKIKHSEASPYPGDKHIIMVYRNDVGIGYVNFRTYRDRWAMMQNAFIGGSPQNIVEGKPVILGNGEAIYVEPAYRNYYRGIGSSLMALALKIAALEGAQSFEARDVDERLDENFFQKIKFTRIRPGTYQFDINHAGNKKGGAFPRARITFRSETRSQSRTAALPKMSLRQTEIEVLQQLFYGILPVSQVVSMNLHLYAAMMVAMGYAQPTLPGMLSDELKVKLGIPTDSIKRNHFGVAITPFTFHSADRQNRIDLENLFRSQTLLISEYPNKLALILVEGDVPQTEITRLNGISSGLSGVRGRIMIIPVHDYEQALMHVFQGGWGHSSQGQIYRKVYALARKLARRSGIDKITLRQLLDYASILGAEEFLVGLEATDHQISLAKWRLLLKGRSLDQRLALAIMSIVTAGEDPKNDPALLKADLIRENLSVRQEFVNFVASLKDHAAILNTIPALMETAKRLLTAA